jgi:hypothetical protein
MEVIAKCTTARLVLYRLRIYMKNIIKDEWIINYGV